MERFQITRRIEIDAAHRVPDHQSKCFNIHGHRYVIEATCEGRLAHAGAEKDMVLDFGFLKEEMVRHIHDPCDHAMIASTADPLLLQIQPACGKLYLIVGSPTAEVLARHWYDLLAPTIQRITHGRAKLACIRVYETPNCYADYPVGVN